ncbi:MAG: choice-of-anchor tandem repeat GloVer-containing protein [Cyanobacteriota bacterium]|nr:choice-of-anchor tandem repeat GloVer-containing protein [Cyanobacteriota bacterium]
MPHLAMGAVCLMALAATPNRAAQAQEIKRESRYTKNKGAIPFAALTPSGGQLFYGTTLANTDNNFGGIYSFNRNTGVINLLDTFTSSNGSVPYAVLTPAGGGLYFGTTYSGGAQDLGGVFAFHSSTGTITLQDSFNRANGAIPYSALTPAGGTLFYGTTHEGGADDLGGIFAFDSSTGRISLQASFNGSNGARFLAALTAGDGELYYGTTTLGGEENLGVIYSFNPVPGPFPLMGVGAALGWSKRLRRGLLADPGNTVMARTVGREQRHPAGERDGR